MQIEHTEIFGFRAALRGMRNPRDSWDQGDSWFRTPGYKTVIKDNEVESIQWLYGQHGPFSKEQHIFVDLPEEVRVIKHICPQHSTPEEPCIGPNDMRLAKDLIAQGGDHRKFMRFVIVTCDFVLPRYVWQEVDTYKVGTVRNSCSTMNTLGKRPLEQEDFQNPLPEIFLQELNRAVQDFREAEGKKSKREARVELKDLLPEGFLQRATYLMNYEVGYRMFWSRRKHRLPMWREGCEGSICEWIKSWPYMKSFLFAGRE